MCDMCVCVCQCIFMHTCMHLYAPLERNNAAQHEALFEIRNMSLVMWATSQSVKERERERHTLMINPEHTNVTQFTVQFGIVDGCNVCVCERETHTFD